MRQNQVEDEEDESEMVVEVYLDGETWVIEGEAARKKELCSTIDALCLKFDTGGRVHFHVKMQEPEYKVWNLYVCEGDLELLKEKLEDISGQRWVS